MTLLLLNAGCVSVSTVAICDGTLEARDKHNSALLKDGGPASISTGATLLRKMDEACQDA